MFLILFCFIDVNKPKKWLWFSDKRFIFVSVFACLLKVGILTRNLRWTFVPLT